MFKFYPSWFTFFFMVLFGLFLVLCGDNWFVIWLGFELTLMCFLPLLVGGVFVLEGSVNYFLVQVGGSSLFVLSFILPFSGFSNILLVLGMFLKLGVFPFYSWVPLVMSCFTWMGCFFVVTIQKVAPLFVLGNCSSVNSNFLVLFSVLSILVGGLLGYNQSYMRSLMAYSSVGHTGWLVISLVFSFSLFLLYFLIYFFLIFCLFFLFSFLNFNKVVFSSLGSKSWGLIVLLFFSLSGVPPFSVFYLKVYILGFLVDFSFYVPLVLLGSMLSVFYYLTFVFFSLPSFWWSGRNFGSLSFFVLLFSFLCPVVFLL